MANRFKPNDGLQGNHGAERLSRTEPQFDDIKLLAPSVLDPKAKEIYMEIGTLLKDAGVLKQTDISILSAFSTTASLIIQAQEKMKDDGIYLESDTGRQYVNPACVEFRANTKTLKDLACELGLTPKSRSGISIPQDTAMMKAKGKLGKFLK